jgi:hypothetical protein
MSDFEILRNLIKTEALASVEDEYNKKIIVLEEPGNEKQSAYTLKIRNVPDDIIAFKADAFPPPNNIFKNSKGECKRADYVVIASDNRANWIVHIEMKSGKGDSKKEVEQQLRGAQCLVAYCRAIGQEFWQESEFLEKKNYQQRFISIKNIGVAKRETLIEPKSGRHDMPERMLKINAPTKGNLEFRKLVGKP